MIHIGIWHLLMRQTNPPSLHDADVSNIKSKYTFRDDIEDGEESEDEEEDEDDEEDEGGHAIGKGNIRKRNHANSRDAGDTAINHTNQEHEAKGQYTGRKFKKKFDDREECYVGVVGKQVAFKRKNNGRHWDYKLYKVTYYSDSDEEEIEIGELEKMLI